MSLKGFVQMVFFENVQKMTYIFPPSNFALSVITPAPIQTTTNILANTVSAWPDDEMLRVLD